MWGVAREHRQSKTRLPNSIFSTRLGISKRARHRRPAPPVTLPTNKRDRSRRLGPINNSGIRLPTLATRTRPTPRKKSPRQRRLSSSGHKLVWNCLAGADEYLHLTFYIFPIVDALERVRYCGVRNEILKLAHVEALSPTVDQDHRQRPPRIWGTPS